MLSRQELYDLMWSEPARSIAPRFGISDVALSKLCARHDIPQPPRGYWAKLAAEKHVPRIPLPPRSIGIREYIQPGRTDHWSYYSVPRDLADREIGPPPTFPESVGDLTARVRRMVGKVSVARDLSRAHAGIRALLEADDARRTNQLGKSYYSSFDAPLFDSAFEKRRLRLMNTVMLALGRCGTKSWLSRKKDPDEVSVMVGHQSISVVVDEPGYQRLGWRIDRDLNKSATTTLRVNLSVRLDGAPTKWEDANDTRVEDQVTDIVVGILVAGELAYRQRELSHHEWLIERKAQIIEERRREVEERERRERERIIALEAARVQRLLADAERHRKADEIRTYVAAVAASPQLFERDESARDRWLAWALAQADKLDPLINGDIGAIF